MIDLLNLTPNKVSQDLSGYITYIYGAPKTGKTTLSTQMEGTLLLAFEPGYHALPGVVAQDILSWGEMRQVYRELQRPEVRERFKALVVDTIDIAADRCKKFICSKNAIEDLGELEYGKGWSQFKDEFNEVFRGITQLGYAVLFIGHHKEIIDEETKTTKIRPAISSSVRTVIGGMADIYGYAHQKYAGEMSVLTLRCSDGSIECGSRFKYLPNEIPCNYYKLTEALSKAIEEEAAENNGKYITTEKIKVTTGKKNYDFNEMTENFQTMVETLMTQSTNNAPKITAIVDKYLGKGKKVANATAEQAEQLELILIELKDLLPKEESV